VTLSLKRVLIANRGEIAVRVMRTARRLGLSTVAVYSQADRDALHVEMADFAVSIGASEARHSYLVIDKIIQAARESGADCIHPGYGFLSERAEFAEAVAAAGLTLVGPPASAMRAMGLKDGAKALMEKAGVPVVPGYHGERQDPAFLRQKAYEIGYPVLIKAVAGGGGKGMKRVDKHAEFEDLLASAQREAQNAFGDPRVLIEKYVLSPRHVEIQVFADTHGHVIHLNERDCSLQRRHQKVIEEAPAPGMTPEVRAIMGRAAVEAARAVGYVGAGTVEFIADGSQGLRADGFWFMEMNTRLQVEHPVTETITGLDLVEWQLRVAAGEKLPLTQDQVPLHGHAVEARLYAEDPEKGFLPSTGRLAVLDFPQHKGIRIDTGVREGDMVSPFYDPMIAKVIAKGATRLEALDRLAEALDDTRVAGPRTNTAFLATLCRAEGFRHGAFDTGFIDRNLEALGAVPRPPDHGAVAAAVHALIEREESRTELQAVALQDVAVASPWSVNDAFQLHGPTRRVARPVLVDGETVRAVIEWEGIARRVDLDGAAVEPARDVHLRFEHPGGAGGRLYALRGGRQVLVALADAAEIDAEQGEGSGLVTSPMHGKVLAVLVAAGQTVEKGQKLAIVEAMKMEHAVTAAREGVIGAIAVEAGQQVGEGARLMVIEAPPEA
jgi:3-methylcrotonyl-CoA carboxylase alpha subunit